MCVQFAAYLYGQGVGELRVTLVDGASMYNLPDNNYDYWVYSTETSTWSTEGTTPGYQTTTETSTWLTEGTTSGTAPDTTGTTGTTDTTVTTKQTNVFVHLATGDGSISAL